MATVSIASNPEAVLEDLVASHAPIEALHLFYLLRDDLPLLYELIAKYRIDTVGKWLSFSVSGRADKLLSPLACK